MVSSFGALRAPPDRAVFLWVSSFRSGARAGDRAEHHFRRADGEIRAVVLADAEGVHAHTGRQLRLGYDVAQDLGVGLEAASASTVTSPKVSRVGSMDDRPS
jgi:hypothetical protein